MNPRILIIYTGGTIGMVQRPDDGSLAPVNFEELSNEIPMLNKFGYKINAITLSPIIDSSNITPELWFKLAETIENNYEVYDGFVVLHGTDTMAYTASALSFMLENLNKPVIFTGSQLPIGTLRTDGKENLLTSIEIAAAVKKGKCIVPEVCIYFNSKLFRGNRSSKIDSAQFRAFESKNYPPLAKAGVEINYSCEYIRKANNDKRLKVNYKLNTNVVILKIFPGIQPLVVESIIDIPDLKGIVLESFGSGNVPEFDWFTQLINKAINKGIIVVNVSQCAGGKVQMGLYHTSKDIQKVGVVSGYDMTSEAAISKIMFLLGQGYTYNKVIKYLNTNIQGEISL